MQTLQAPEVEVKDQYRKKKEVTIDLDKVFSLACLGVSVTSLVMSIKTIAKVNGFSKKIGMSIDDLTMKTHVDISDELVRKFTEKAVDKAAANAAKTVSEELRLDMYDILSTKVADAVSNQYDNVKDEVTKELRKKVSNISVSALKAQIIDEASKNIVEKLENQMDDIIAAQTDKLESMSKAYKEMGKFMKDKA